MTFARSTSGNIDQLVSRYAGKEFGAKTASGHPTRKPHAGGDPLHMVLDKHFVLRDAHAIAGLAALSAEKDFYSGTDRIHET